MQYNRKFKGTKEAALEYLVNAGNADTFSAATSQFIFDYVKGVPEGSQVNISASAAYGVYPEIPESGAMLIEVTYEKE
jgi:hypothetical protein